MSPLGKPDPAQGWQFVEKLIADDSLQIDGARSDEVTSPMATKGGNATEVPSADDLLAKAQERAAKRPARGEYGPIVTAISTARSAPWWLWPAAAAFCGIAGVVVAYRLSSHATKELTTIERAADVRRAALRDCDAKEWQRCWKGLDEARDFDPEGDLAPLVVRARARAAAGMGTRAPEEKGTSGP
jgi:hypothetical protein